MAEVRKRYGRGRCAGSANTDRVDRLQDVKTLKVTRQSAGKSFLGGSRELRPISAR
jgi:hypothetical protein